MRQDYGYLEAGIYRAPCPLRQGVRQDRGYLEDGIYRSPCPPRQGSTLNPGWIEDEYHLSLTYLIGGPLPV